MRDRGQDERAVLLGGDVARAGEAMPCPARAMCCRATVPWQR
jgi:hypothetical protein